MLAPLYSRRPTSPTLVSVLMCLEGNSVEVRSEAVTPCIHGSHQAALPQLSLSRSFVFSHASLPHYAFHVDAAAEYVGRPCMRLHPMLCIFHVAPYQQDDWMKHPP